jgi:inhibitor of cysteine peptidase
MMNRDVLDQPFVPLVHATCIGIAMLVLASCATLSREGNVAPLDGGSVAVRQGAPLVINLSADPATGFGWVLTGKPGDAVWLIGGPDYTPDPIPAGMMGVGGTTTYRFRAEAPGTQTLEFAYLPSWDRGVAPVKTVRYDVTVTSAGWYNWF